MQTSIGRLFLFLSSFLLCSMPIELPSAVIDPLVRPSMGVKLASGAQLAKGASINVRDAKLALQDDGNLVFYYGTVAVWATNTNGKTVTHAIMQADGNLVLYNGDVPVWSSDTMSVGSKGWYLYCDLLARSSRDQSSVGIYTATGKLIKALSPTAHDTVTPDGPVTPPAYAYSGSGKWQTQTLDSAGDVGDYASMLLNKAGNPVISYYDGTRSPPGASATQATGNGDLKLVVCGNPTCSSGNTVTTVFRGRTNISDRVGEFTSLALDSKGNPVIAFYGEGLSLAVCNNPTCSGGARVTPNIVPSNGPSRIEYISLVLGAFDIPWISYSEVRVANGVVAPNVKYVKCKNSDCAGSNVSVAVDVGSYNSIALTDKDVPIISYYQSGLADLYVAVCGGPPATPCKKSSVDTTGDVGQFNSIRLIPSRDLWGIITSYIPFISYYDATNRDLKAVYCGDSGCIRGNTIQVLDSVGDVGQYSSTARSQDFIVSYYDATNRLLKEASCDRGAPFAKIPTRPCQVKDSSALKAMADTSGYVEKSNSSSLVVDQAGTHFITYYDPSNGDLKITTGVPFDGGNL